MVCFEFPSFTNAQKTHNDNIRTHISTFFCSLVWLSGGKSCSILLRMLSICSCIGRWDILGTLLGTGKIEIYKNIRIHKLHVDVVFMEWMFSGLLCRVWIVYDGDFSYYWTTSFVFCVFLSLWLRLHVAPFAHKCHMWICMIVCSSFIRSAAL